MQLSNISFSLTVNVISDGVTVWSCYWRCTRSIDNKIVSTGCDSRVASMLDCVSIQLEIDLRARWAGALSCWNRRATHFMSDRQQVLSQKHLTVACTLIFTPASMNIRSIRPTGTHLWTPSLTCRPVELYPQQTPWFNRSFLSNAAHKCDYSDDFWAWMHTIDM